MPVALYAYIHKKKKNQRKKNDKPSSTKLLPKHLYVIHRSFSFYQVARIATAIFAYHCHSRHDLVSIETLLSISATLARAFIFHVTRWISIVFTRCDDERLFDCWQSLLFTYLFFYREDRRADTSYWSRFARSKAAHYSVLYDDPLSLIEAICERVYCLYKYAMFENAYEAWPHGPSSSRLPVPALPLVILNIYMYIHL